MPCRSWSLQALDTCPASRDATGALVPACSGCYATTGNYRFKNVRAPREHNREDWKRDTWVDDMVSELDNDRYFRWFDSGDMYDISPSVQDTRSLRAYAVGKTLDTHTDAQVCSKFGMVLARLEALPNVVVRLSSDSITGETIQGSTTSTICNA
jgi:hypothetical protein